MNSPAPPSHFELEPRPFYTAPPIKAERLPTNTTADRHPVHRWFNFIAGFSPEFVHGCLEGLPRTATTRLLDPFAGCGTAPLVAIQRGLSSVGFEAHPIFSRIARAKTGSLSSNSFSHLDRIEDAVICGFQKPYTNGLSVDAATFLNKLFPPDVLHSILGARHELERTGLVGDDLAFLFLSRVVEKCSHSQTDGIYKAPTSKKRSLTPIEACAETARMIANDLYSPNVQNLPGHAIIHPDSSLDMSKLADEDVDVVVTSPPYLNNFDYAEMTRMQLYFWGMADSWSDITDRVRSRLIVNTTTALKGHKSRQEEYRATICPDLQSELAGLVEALAQLRTQRAGKKEYDYLVYPYFSQMSCVLRECYRCLKRGGSVHIMVADAALYGVHISTPQYLKTILDKIGFKETRCDLVRTRGHRWLLEKREGSKTGLGEYHVSGRK